MNKKILYTGIAVIVIIVAGINVTLNNSTGTKGSLSLSNIEALSDGECESCNYTLTPLPCYKSSDITYNPHESLRDICPVSGNMCPMTTIRGCINQNASTYICHYKNYH